MQTFYRYHNIENYLYRYYAQYSYFNLERNITMYVRLVWCLKFIVAINRNNNYRICNIVNTVRWLSSTFQSRDGGGGAAAGAVGAYRGARSTGEGIPIKSCGR